MPGDDGGGPGPVGFPSISSVRSTVPPTLSTGSSRSPVPASPGYGVLSRVPGTRGRMGETDSVRIERSPADVLRLVVAAGGWLVLLLVEWLFGDTLIAFESDLLRGLDALPQWLVDVVTVGTRILTLVVLGGGLAWTLYRQRWRMLVTVALAGLLAAVLFPLLDDLVNLDDGRDPVDVSDDVGALGDEGFPTTIGIAVVAAVLTAAAPWLSRRWRRVGWVLLLGLMATRFLATPVSFDSLEAALIGWLAGAGVLVAMGAPSRRPTREAVVDGLAGVGLAVRRLDPAGVDARGSTPYFGVASDASNVFVKALGDDERSADVLFRLYRRVTPRDFGDEKPFRTLRRTVEHEALVALAARDLGVRTPRLRAFATADPNGYVLAYEAIEGKSLDRLDGSDITDGVLAACWRLVGHLRGHRIAHRDLRLANIFLDDDGEVWLIDFGFSEMAASDLLLANDVAELVASSSLPVGPQRAVAHAASTVDPGTLARALDRLHPWALSGATRTALKSRSGLLDELRSRMAEAIAAASADAKT
jgi:glycosyltransferase 2 family protein